MTVSDQIKAFEAELGEAGITVLAVLARVEPDGLAPSTWFRWRDCGVIPRLDNWEAAKAAVATALEEKRQGQRVAA